MEDPDTQAPEASTGAVFNFDNNPDPDSLTPTGGAKDYLWIALTSRDAPSASTVTVWPTNYDTAQVDNVHSNNGGASVSSSERDLNASSEDPSAYTTSTNEDHVAVTIAVHPAAAAGANPKGPLGMPLHGPFGGPIGA